MSEYIQDIYITGPTGQASPLHPWYAEPDPASDALKYKGDVGIGPQKGSPLPFPDDLILFKNGAPVDPSNVATITFPPIVVPIMSQPEPITMNVTVQGINLSLWQAIKLVSSCPDSPDNSIESAFEAWVDPQSMTAAIELNNSARFGICGGFSGMLQLSLSGDDKSGEPQKRPLINIYLEIYWVQKDLPGALEDGDGIPLTMLRMFLGTPNKWTVFEDEDEWQRNAAGIIFGSIAPVTLKDKTPPNTTETEVIGAAYMNHWVKYNFVNGATNFWYGPDRGPGLRSWLNVYRIWIADPKIWCTVNCYDQGDILEIALALGINHNRIIREYWSPYGYINEYLVGWGLCNNPFFNGILDDKFLTLDPTTQTNPARTGFGNHVYTVVLPTDNAVLPTPFPCSSKSPKWLDKYSDRQILDACGGPCYGKTHADYYATVTPYTKAEIVQLELEKKYYYGWSQHSTMAWDEGVPDTIEKVVSRYKIKGSTTPLSTLEPFSDYAKTVTGTFQGKVSALFKAFTMFFQETAGPKTLHQQIVPPYDGHNGSSVVIEKKLWDISAAGVVYSTSFISLKFVVASNAVEALHLLSNQLERISLPGALSFRYVGAAGINTPLVESSFLKLFMYRNIIIMVTTLTGFEAFGDDNFGAVRLNEYCRRVLSDMMTADLGAGRSVAEYRACLEGLKAVPEKKK